MQFRFELKKTMKWMFWNHYRQRSFPHFISLVCHFFCIIALATLSLWSSDIPPLANYLHNNLIFPHHKCSYHSIGHSTIHGMRVCAWDRERETEKWHISTHLISCLNWNLISPFEFKPWRKRQIQLNLFTILKENLIKSWISLWTPYGSTILHI